MDLEIQMHSTSRWYVMVCVAMLGWAGLRWAGLGWLPAYHHGHLLARLHSEREAFQNAGVLRGRVAKAHVAELNPSLELCRLELLRLFIATRHTHACVSSATSTITTNGRDRRVGGQTGRQVDRRANGRWAVHTVFSGSGSIFDRVSIRSQMRAAGTTTSVKEVILVIMS